jgi:hypothetical protein
MKARHLRPSIGRGAADENGMKVPDLTLVLQVARDSAANARETAAALRELHVKQERLLARNEYLRRLAGPLSRRQLIGML